MEAGAFSSPPYCSGAPYWVAVTAVAKAAATKVYCIFAAVGKRGWIIKKDSKY